MLPNTTKMNNEQYPAFPTPINQIMALGGLTKLEYFTAMAMQGLCAHNDWDASAIANHANKIARATLLQLKNEQE